MDKRNLLLAKEVDEKNHKTTYKRHFETTGPNEKWTTDVSEFKLPTGKLYLSPILDMYDSSIISYDISTSPSLEQTKRMLNEAFKQYPNLEGLIFHSDQGWQYQHQYYINELKKAIQEYIKYYNEKRINVKRKGLSPLAYRQQSLS